MLMEHSRFQLTGSTMSFTVSTVLSAELFTCRHPSDISTWDPKTFTIAGAKVAEDQKPFDIATWNGNISAFQNNGGKQRKIFLSSTIYKCRLHVKYITTVKWTKS
jgi:hypothetical protein